MKPTKTSDNHFNFSVLGKLSCLLLLVGFSIKGFGQIYISDNAIVTVNEGTILHIAHEESDSTQQKAKVYVGKNATIKNFPSDSLVEIVYLDRSDQSQKESKRNLAENKKPQPAEDVAKKEPKSEDKKPIVAFASKKNNSSSLYFSNKSTRAALVNSSQSGLKLLALQKTQKDNFRIILSDTNNLKFEYFFKYSALQSQICLGGYITRPPPFLVNFFTRTTA